MAIEMQQIIELILAIFLPPLAIFIHGSDCNIHVAVNIILCFFLLFAGDYSCPMVLLLPWMNNHTSCYN
ncbi:hypothetical protein DICVIV_12280 [Dictyocaulus viviparus]|uniref:Uncharacterized protein n=1 Tax=Dictyocaulus viviparus TaxID=29172 RepID=A0A0D8XHD7_DICVI|nr:hypothetical protein DICVIV_12280 [Dictyocaulus viviparus]